MIDASLFSAMASGSISLNESQTKYIVAALMDNLKKAQDATTVGYQTGPSAASGDAATLSPLLPQSIDPTLTSLAIQEKELVMWRMMPKGTATQTLHEYRRKLKHGSLVQDHNVGEGSAGNNSSSKYSMASTTIKFWSVRREITDVAAGLTGIAPASNLLTEHTNEASFDLLRAIEMDVMFGDADLLATKATGFIKQIADSGNITDLDGEQITLDHISMRLRILGQSTSARGAIYPTHILTTHMIWNDLERQERNSGGRFQKDQKDPKFYFGAEAIFVRGPQGDVPIIAIPFLDDQRVIGLPDNESTGLDPNATAPAAPTAAGLGAGITSPADAASRFKVADAGSYYYKVVAHNADGYSAAYVSAAIPVAAGDKVLFKLDTPGSKLPAYYRVYRSLKDGAAADCSYLFSVKRAAGGGFDTFGDFNAVKPNTGRVIFWTNQEDHVTFYRLLPMARVPLAKIQLTTPFAIFMSGSPVVKLPEKFWMMTNVGYAAAL